jgi:phospholipid-binding lipoprotein MlaA
MRFWEPGRDPRKICVPGRTVCLILLAGLFLCLSSVHAAADGPDALPGAGAALPAVGNPSGEAGSISAASAEKPSDEYGNVTEEGTGSSEEFRIADPIEPWNRAMYHVNDNLYFWLLKPTTRGYKHVVPEDVRGLFGNFYRNVKVPVRIVNNFLQGTPGYAGLETARFLINSTVGVGGLRDCATECFGINGRDADFGQTLGKYGVGFGFYVVWPLLGPSSPRDTVGWVADHALRPTTYVSSQWISLVSVGLYAHETVNYTSFHLGDYEAIKGAAIDPYIAMRDAYVQYRKKLIER